jgi:prophage regulatory protein
MPEPNTPLRFMRLHEVVVTTGLPRSTIYWMAKEGRFPKPFKLSARSSAWRADEIAQWQRERLEEP